jgi:hypothetical protein
MNVVDGISRVYTALVNNGVPAEDARGLLPHAVLTRLNYKTNLRGLAEHAGNRLCTQAQFHWRVVLAQVVSAIRNHDSLYRQGNAWVPADWQWKLIASSVLFRPVCYAVGHCPFAGSWDRGCTIRERVDSGRWDEINEREWLLDPAAAREA